MWTGAGVYARSDHRVADWRLHPLIHTLLEFTVTQNMGLCKRFPSFYRWFPQTGHTFSVGPIDRLALHWGHLTLKSLTLVYEGIG